MMNQTLMAFGRGAPDTAYVRNPFPDLARLRDAAPRYYAPEHDAWIISARADIARLLRDDRLMITRSSSFADQSAEFRNSVVRRLREWLLPATSALMQIAAATAERCAMSLPTHGECDLVDTVAHFVPSRMMAELLGIPTSDVPALQRLSQDLLRSYDLAWDGRPDPMFVGDMLPLYFQNHWRTGADTSLLRMLRDCQTEHALPEASMIDTCLKLFTAGTTTTAGCFANILARLVGGTDEPDLSIGPDAADELLRRDAPVLAVKRMVHQTIQLGDACLEPGQKVILMVASANREPHPAGQRQAPDLTFGLGRHHCLGAHLARIELAALLDRFGPLASRMRLAAPIAWRQAWLVHEAQSIRVRITE